MLCGKIVRKRIK